MRIPGFALILVLAIVGRAADQKPSQEPKEFTPKSGTFTITLPAGVSSGHRTETLKIGKHSVPVELMQSSCDGVTCTAGSIAMPAGVIRQIPAEKRFQVISEALVKPLQGKLLEGKDIKQDPVSGKDYQIERPNGLARMQVYLSGDWVLYALVEGKTKEQVNSKEVAAFYSSFKLSQKTKDRHPK